MWPLDTYQNREMSTELKAHPGRSVGLHHVVGIFLSCTVNDNVIGMETGDGRCRKTSWIFFVEDSISYNGSYTTRSSSAWLPNHCWIVYHPGNSTWYFSISKTKTKKLKTKSMSILITIPLLVYNLWKRHKNSFQSIYVTN